MWLTKRVILDSNDDMAGAISIVLVGFVNDLEAQGAIKRWYSSLKNDDGIPSFRLYLEISDDDKPVMVAKLDDFLRKKTDQIGWSGEYHSPNPTFNPAHKDLDEIIKACKSVLKLVKKHPSLSRVSEDAFWSDVRTEVVERISSMDPVHYGAYIHFVANNFGISDETILKVAGFYKNKSGSWVSPLPVHTTSSREEGAFSQEPYIK